jgi:hypothetical protein
MPGIEVKNLDAVVSLLSRVRNGYNERDIAKLMKDEGADPLRDELRDAAPQGPSGRLKKAIVSRIARAKDLAPAVYVLVSRRLAPHLHFVTGGTKPHQIRAKMKRALTVGGGPAYVSVQHPGARANDYFAQTYSRLESRIAGMITTALGKLFDKSAQ